MSLAPYWAASIVLAAIGTTARAWDWLDSDTALICPERDDQHQAAFDALMPAEPMPLNQPTLNGGQA